MTLLRSLLLLAFLLPHTGRAAGKWETWENCRLMPSKANDGDSFKVRKDGGRYTYILRLYFVDTAETDRSLEDRMKDQAEYWGISVEDVYKLGKVGTKFTENFLKKGFTVYTRKEKARGRSEKNRYYALIEVDGLFLSDALMKEGLARFYGAQVDMPQGLPSKSRFRLRLKGSENEARKMKRGGWGMATSAPAAGAPSLFAEPAATDISQEPLPDTIVLRSSVPVYSIREPGRMVGTLTPGMTVTVLDQDSGTSVRVRFKTRSGKTFEALVRRSNLAPSL